MLSLFSELNSNMSKLSSNYTPITREDSEICSRHCEEESSDPLTASSRNDTKGFSEDCSDSVLTEETKFLKYMDDSD